MCPVILGKSLKFPAHVKRHAIGWLIARELSFSSIDAELEELFHFLLIWLILHEMLLDLKPSFPESKAPVTQINASIFVETSH